MSAGESRPESTWLPSHWSYVILTLYQRIPLEGVKQSESLPQAEKFCALGAPQSCTPLPDPEANSVDASPIQTHPTSSELLEDSAIPANIQKVVCWMNDADTKLPQHAFSNAKLSDKSYERPTKSGMRLRSPLYQLLFFPTRCRQWWQISTPRLIPCIDARYIRTVRHQFTLDLDLQPWEIMPEPNLAPFRLTGPSDMDSSGIEMKI